MAYQLVTGILADDEYYLLLFLQRSRAPEYAKVIIDYEAANGEELSVAAGEQVDSVIIVVLNSMHSLSGWNHARM